MLKLLHGDCLNTMPTMEENSIDAIVTDPPYGLSFMGKNWDHGVPGVAFWREALRVAKPGAHLLAFGGSRTYHRLACAIEDAGWEIRDTIMWVYGSGFPKSHNVSKAIDREAGITEWKETTPNPAWRKGNGDGKTTSTGWAKPQRPPKPVIETPLARQWDGWGTALKPAHEPIIMARKPFPGTVAQNVTTWGTGAINVDGGRVESSDVVGASGGWGFTPDKGWNQNSVKGQTTDVYRHTNGRWPANLIHDGSEEVLAGFPVTGPSKSSQRGAVKIFEQGDGQWIGDSTERGHNDNGGSAARFFYCAKASKADRDEGCGHLDLRQTIGGGGTNDPNGDDVCGKYGSVKSLARNHHPTVKPTDLMRYLVRLVTPPDGIVLDPFMGSGSTGKAAILEGFGFVGIEREREYIDIAKARIGAAVDTAPLFREYTNG